MPRVSIGLPFSDQDHYLQIALKSVLAQTYRDWELLLVGDGATAASIGVAEHAAGGDRRVKLALHEDRKGLANRLNEICDMASGEYLFRMDADDIMRSHRVEKQVQSLDDGRFDVVGARAFAIDQEGALCGLFKEPQLPNFPSRSLSSNLFTHPTVAGKTEWFDANRYDESFLRTQDKELWLRTMNSSRFWKDSEPLLFYRVRLAWSASARRLSSKYDRRAVRLNGPRVAGKVSTGVYLAKSYLKDGIYAGADRLGLSSRIQVSKVAPLTSDLREVARELQRISELGSQ